MSKQEILEQESESQPKLKGGELLKSVRVKRGVSLDMVHEATKIPMDALRAMEEGYTVRTLTPFYMKGFLKIYAHFLSLDASEVVDDCHKETLPPVIKRDPTDFDLEQWVQKLFPKHVKQRLVIVFVYAVCFFMIFKVITFFTNGSDEKSTKAVVTTGSVVKEEKKSKSLIREEERKKKAFDKKKAAEDKKLAEANKKKERDTAANKKMPKDIKEVVAVVPAVPVQKQAQVTQIPIENTADNVTLTVRAKKNSWLRVAVDGNVVFQSTLRTGSVETWIATDKVEISGKNINFLEFELNGKMIGSLGREDRSAKKLVVTKDGLTVTQ
ncbi:MAG: cytoskeletal protein RodZ [Candidatus Omnitrophota bacterium]|jgi:cytoskeletal protein RodZ